MANRFESFGVPSSGKLSEDTLASLVWRELDVAQGYDEDVLAEKRQNALEFYQGIMAAPVDGRSDIVSYDVADTVHAILSQIGPLYKSSIIEFVPTNEQDEAQAQLETDAVRAVIDQNDAWNVLQGASHDALLMNNGWIKVWVEENEEVEREEYAGIDDLALYEIMQPRAERQTVEITSQEQAEDMAGMDISIKRVTPNNRLVVESIAPEVMVFSPMHNQLDFQELRFVAERKLLSVSDLLDLGASMDEIDSMPPHTDDWWPGIVAREGHFRDTTDDDLGGKQDASRLKEVFDCYFRVDLEGNGHTELRHIMIGGYEVIINEPASWIPYVTGSPVPMPHRIVGQGMYEIMRQIQTGKTVILRNYLDTLELQQGSKTAYMEGEVSLEDLEEGRTDGLIACKGRPGDVLMPFPVNPVGAEVITGLNYLDQVRTSRGGASLDLNDSNMQIAQSSAAAAIGEYNAKERMAAWYSSNLANTLLKGMFYLTHLTLREGKLGQINAKRRGKWEQVDPSQWPERRNCRVDVGLTSGEKGQRKQDYALLVTHLEGLMQAGGEGVITDKNKVYNAMADFIRVADLGPPEEYIIDPSSDESVAKQKEISQQQQQQQAQLAEMQKQMQQFEAWKIDQELKFKYYDTNIDNETDRMKAGIDAEIEEAKMTADAVVEITKNADQEGSNERSNGSAR